MIWLSRDTTKTLLAVHGWSGILLGLLLYAVICTGVAAVFATEINNWASPLTRDATISLPAGVDRAVRDLAGQVDPQYHEEVAAWRGAGGRLIVFFHRHMQDPEGRLNEYGVQFELHPETHEVLARREGWYDDIAAQSRPEGVAAFLVDLHVRLHIPEPWGLLVTGILGMAMMIAALTGLFAHRHLLKEMFTLRLAREALLRRRDLHVVAGTWNLPFAFILAFTGSFFSFATTLGLPLVAKATFGGNEEALIETLYGAPREEKAEPAPLADLDAMIADAAARSGITSHFIGIERYGRADATVWVYQPLPENELVYTSHLYDGTTGEYLTERPPLGQHPSLGASLVGLMYPLHFGNFAGIASKAAWVGLGFAGAYVTLTGLLLWTQRRIDQRAWQRMARLVHYVGYGLPLALACAPHAHFLFQDSTLSSGTLQGFAFIGAAAVAAIVSLTCDELRRLRRILLTATAVAVLALPFTRFAGGGPGWFEAWSSGLPGVAGVDITLLLVGASTLWLARRRVTATHAASLRPSLEARTGSA